MRLAYIVVLTNGKHFTDERNAAILLDAIDRGDRVAELQLDLQGDGLSIRTVKLVTQNLVMLIGCPEVYDLSDEFRGIMSNRVTKLKR